MRKETFLKLCGERDRSIIVGETPPDMNDLLRLEYLAGLLGCLEVELSVYFTRHEKEPILEPESSASAESQWWRQFLRDAPNGETIEKICRLMKRAE